MRSLTINSPAKVNLFLRVLRRRPDGDHELETLFHRISLTDEIIIQKVGADKPAPTIKPFELITSHPKLRNIKENLIYKAYRLLKKQGCHLDSPIRVTLKKKIPIAAGLGGGSSNAAHFLLGMNRLFRLGLSRAKLCNLGAKLGSDVPFFLCDTNQALGRGRGEKITPMPSEEKHWFVIVVPPFEVSTKEVYQRFSEMKPSAAPRRLTRISRFSTITSDVFRNDLFPASCAVRPELGELKLFFEGLNIPMMMSGSGSAFFGVFLNRKETERAVRKIRKLRPDLKVSVSHTY